MTFARRSQQAVTATIPGGGGGGGGTGGVTLMGVSDGNDHGSISQWDAMRIYKFSAVSDAVAAGAQIVCLTDEPNCPLTGGQSSADYLDSQLSSLFSKWPNLEVHWGNGNELDTDASAAGFSFADYGTTMAAMRSVIDKYQGLGYKCSLWIDLTVFHIRTAPDVEANLKAVCAQYLDGIACSLYPPGRTKSPLEYSDFDTFIKPTFDLAVDWGVSQVECWETGIGPDTNSSHTASTNETASTVDVRIYGQSSLTTLNVGSLKQVRPAYAAYMAKYMIEIGQAYGIATPALCWWDSQTDPTTPDNIMSDDPAGTSPTTAQCWHDWQNYVS